MLASLLVLPLFSLGSAILMLYEADAANTFDGKRGVTLEAHSIDAYFSHGLTRSLA